MTYDGLAAALEPIGRHPVTGGYRRYAWTQVDAALREWFAGEAAARGLDLVVDRAGNQWAGVACAGSRLLTGDLGADRARGLRDADGVSMAEAMAAFGHDPAQLGPDAETLRRVGTFVELHVEQGRGLAELDRPAGVGSSIWPQGRWRLDLLRNRSGVSHSPAEYAERADCLAGVAALTAVLADRAR